MSDLADDTIREWRMMCGGLLADYTLTPEQVLALCDALLEARGRLAQEESVSDALMSERDGLEAERDRLQERLARIEEAVVPIMADLDGEVIMSFDECDDARDRLRSALSETEEQ